MTVIAEQKESQKLTRKINHPNKDVRATGYGDSNFPALAIRVEGGGLKALGVRDKTPPKIFRCDP